MALRFMAQIAYCPPPSLSVFRFLTEKEMGKIRTRFDRFAKFSWPKCFLLRKNDPVNDPVG